MKVLVAGAGGYIGHPLCSALLTQGHEVTALDRYFFGIYPPNGCIVAFADIRTMNPAFLHGIDCVIDLAGLSNDASADIDPELTTDINLRGAIRLANMAKSAGVKKYIYSSSCSVYGSGEHEGLKETDDCHPLTRYAESKLGVEEHLRKIASHEFDPVILRNATVFGVAPRMRFDLAVNVMTLRAWRDDLIYVMGGGQQHRPFIHVLDVARAIVMAAEHKGYSNQTFNVGGDDMNHSIEQLASMVKRIFPAAAIHHIPDDADRRSYHVSFQKIRETFPFKCHHNIIEGICGVRQALMDGKTSGDDPTTRTVEWYKSLMDWEVRLNEIRLEGKIL